MTQTELSDDQIDAERAAFERYFSENGKHPKAVERFPWGGYKLASAAAAWTTWHARALMAREAVEVPQWQPIETVPEIGEFLVYTPGEVSKVQAARRNVNGVFIIGNTFAFDLTKPTHWMPLPASPTKGQL